MDSLIGKRLAVLSNVHRVHDARIYYREVHFAAKSGMCVSLLALDDGYQSQGVAIRPFPVPTSRFRRFWLGWRLAYLAYRQGADVCHFHDPEMLLPMTLLRLVTRKPVVYDCHENLVDSIYYKPYVPTLLRPIVSKLTFVAQWVCAKVLGSVVIATEEQLGMFPASIRHVVVRNFPPRFIQQELNGHAERPFELVHCGGLSRERGSYVLFETLRILVRELDFTDCRLLLIGVPREQLEADCEKFIVQHDLERNIEFRGFIPLHNVPRELAKARIGLMCHQATSQYRYGVASKLFDYMAAGLAIVGGRADFDREFAPEETVKIFVDETKPREYADAVGRLLDNDPLREQMGRNARTLFEEKYTAESQADDLLQFYRKHFRPHSKRAA